MNKYIEDVKYFRYSELSQLEKSIYHSNIYKFVQKLVWEYPAFREWYKGLFLENYELNVEREIILCEKFNRIAGISILKNSEQEKKICTLRVAKEYQHQGIGKRLMELSFEWLQDDRPMITLRKTKINQFSPLFEYYGFQLEQKQRSYYNIFSTELVYNGSLPDKEIIYNEMEVVDMCDVCQRLLSVGKTNFKKFLDIYLEDRYRQEQMKRMELIRE